MPRLMSFKQLYDFFNLCLNKSLAVKRVRSVEEDIFEIKKDLKEYHEWRE